MSLTFKRVATKPVPASEKIEINFETGKEGEKIRFTSDDGSLHVYVARFYGNVGEGDPISLLELQRIHLALEEFIDTMEARQDKDAGAGAKRCEKCAKLPSY